MRHYLAFPLASGSDVVVVEVDELAEAVGHEPASLSEAMAQTAGKAFEAALARVKPIAAAVIASMNDISEAVSEVNVEFGLKLNAETGVVITSGGVEANFKVSLKWKR
jgi:hypothetical protein